MKRHIAPILIVLSFLLVAYALGGSGAATRTVTSATLTINVGQAHFMEIYNFTQTGAASSRGVVTVGIFPTPTPTPTPTATPVPTPTPSSTDLTATKTDNVGGQAVSSNPWAWTIHVANGGNTAGSFLSTQTILSD